MKRIRVLRTDLVQDYLHLTSKDSKIIELVADRAERKAQELLGRTFNDIEHEYRHIPSNIINACLMLAESAYRNWYKDTFDIPYVVPFLLKPYSKDKDEQDNRSEGSRS